MKLFWLVISATVMSLMISSFTFDAIWGTAGNHSEHAGIVLLFTCVIVFALIQSETYYAKPPKQDKEKE